MEFFVSSDIILTLIGGVLVTILANLLKPLMEKYNPQAIVLGVAILVGAAYTAFVTFVPQLHQEAILNFTLHSLSLAVLVYEFIWKNLYKKVESE